MYESIFYRIKCEQRCDIGYGYDCHHYSTLEAAKIKQFNVICSLQSQ